MVYLCYAADWEYPEYFLADHDLDAALVHAAGRRNEGKGDLEDAKGLDLETVFEGVYEMEELTVGGGAWEEFYTYGYFVFEGVTEFD